MVIRRYGLPVGIALLSGGQFFFGSQIESHSGALAVVFVTLGTALAVGSAYLTARLQEDVRHGREEMERAVVLEAALGPVSEWLGRLPGSADLLGNINDRLTETASELAHPRAHAMFYALREHDTKLVRLAHTDTTAAPIEIIKGTETGDYLINLALDSRDRYIEDINKDTGKGRVPLSDDHRTARILRVRAGHQALGLLIVDAPRPGDLEGSRELALSGIAHLLGAAQLIRGDTESGTATLPHPADPPDDSLTSGATPR